MPTLCAWHTHRKLCRTHKTEVGEERAFGDGCWMATQREKEKPVHQQETVAQPASLGQGGWGEGRGGGWLNRLDNMQEQILSATTTEKYEGLYLSN